MPLTFRSHRLKAAPVLGYLSYQQSDFVLVVTRYNFSAIAGLYAFFSLSFFFLHVSFLNLGLESLFNSSLRMMSYFQQMQVF